MSPTLPEVPRIIAITDVERCGGRDELCRRAQILIEGGLPALLVRVPGASPGSVHELALKLRPACKANGTLFLVHGLPSVAIAVGADGIHLPSQSPLAEQLATLAPEFMLRGQSCHDKEELATARALGMHYVFLSPWRDPVSHEPNRGPLGREGFQRLVFGVGDLPVLALGGIRSDDIPAVRQAGGWGVAAISAFWDNPSRIGDWL